MRARPADRRGPPLSREEELRRGMAAEKAKQEKLGTYVQQLSTAMGEQIYRAKNFRDGAGNELRKCTACGMPGHVANSKDCAFYTAESAAHSMNRNVQQTSALSLKISLRDADIDLPEEMGTKLNLSKLTQKRREGAREKKRQRKEEEAAEGNAYSKRLHKQPTKQLSTTRLPRVQLNAILEGVCVELHNVEHMMVFAHPVSELEAPGYAAAIANPMCLGDMLAKCHRFEYRTADEFLNDVQLVHTNCEQWNHGKPSMFLIERSKQLVKAANALVGAIKQKRLFMLYNLIHANGSSHGATGNSNFDHRD